MTQTVSTRSFSKVRRRILAAATALVMGVGLAGVATAPAMAAGTGVIAGTVTGTSSAPLQNISVQIFFCDPNYNPQQQTTCWSGVNTGGQILTNAAGAYSIPNLSPGQYTAAFFPQSGANLQYAYEYWNNKTSLETAVGFTVADGATTTISPSLQLGAKISGTVVGPDSLPAPATRVSATSSATPNQSTFVAVKPDGSYEFIGLQPGEYYLWAGPDGSAPSTLVREYYDNKADAASATRFTVASGQTFTANFQLANGGVISGNVKNSSSANLAGIDVTISQKDQYGYWRSVKTAETDASGNYSVQGLESGSYVVRFSDFGGTYGQRYGGGSVDRETATLYPAGPGINATVNGQLSAGGTITGVVTQTATGGSAVPSDNAYVDIIKVAGGVHEVVSTARTNASGVYTLAGLAAGSYTIQASGNTGGWAPIYRGQKYYPEEATTLSITAGASANAGTTNLVPGTSISGYFTDTNLAPVPSVRVNILYERTPGNWVAPPPHGGSGDINYYNAGGMPPGKYIVYFEDTATTGTKYVTQYYNNKPTLGTAQVLDATNGGTFTDITARMTKTPWPAVTATATAAPASPNGSNGWYKSGNVSVTLTSGGGTAVADKLEYKKGTGSWTAYTAPVVVDADGTTTITYRAVEEGLQTSAEGTLVIKRDTAVPTVASTLSGRSVTITSNDAVSGIASTEYRIGTSGNWIAYTAPVNVGKFAATVQFRATDAAGNVSTVGSRGVPAQSGTVSVTTSTSPAAPNAAGWFKSDVTVTGAGTAELGGPVTIQSKVGSGTFAPEASRTVTEDGTTVVTFKGTDEVGNVSGEVPATVKLDKTAPTVSSALSGANVLTVTGADATSGIALLEYRLGTGAWTTYTTPVAVGGAAVTVQFRSTDAAGNVSAVGSREVPKGTVTVATTPSAAEPASGWYTSNVTITGTGTATASGATVTVASKVGTGAYADTAARPVATEGTTTLTFQARDQWSNVSSEKVVTVKLDKTKPTLSHSFAGNALTLSAADAGSGVAKIEYRAEGTTAWLTYNNPVIPAADVIRIEYRATDVAGLVSNVASVTVGIPEPERISGANRYDTAVQSSVASYPTPFTSGGVVYITTGTLFPDALSAGPAAAKAGGPLLLVSPTEVPASVITEIDRLNPAKIVVIGGEPSINAAAFNQLKAIDSSITVKRLAGANRYETSRLVTREAFNNATYAYIATGENFPDALAAGGAAGSKDAPVILVQGGATGLDSPTKALLADLGVTQVKVLGGPSVSAGIEADLKALVGTSNVKRFAGTNRYDTARLVNKDAFIDTNANPGYVFLSTGINFPDALAGSAWAAKEDSPLYTVQTDCIPQAVLDDIAKLKPDNLVLLGGTPTLSDAVANLTPCE